MTLRKYLKSKDWPYERSEGTQAPHSKWRARQTQLNSSFNRHKRCGVWTHGEAPNTKYKLTKKNKGRRSGLESAVRTCIGKPRDTAPEMKHINAAKSISHGILKDQLYDNSKLGKPHLNIWKSHVYRMRDQEAMQRTMFGNATGVIWASWGYTTHRIQTY